MEPLLLDPSVWVLLCTIGFIAGFIDAIAGGGGMLTVPALLAAGLPPHIALGTNKLAASFGSLTASVAFYRKRLFNPKFWYLSLIATAIGAVTGTLLVSYISTDFLEKILPLLILVTALYTLVSKTVINKSNNLPANSPSLKTKQIVQGVTLGFYDGVAGPGTGAFWLASSNFLYKINILLSSGLAKSNNFISNLCSLVTFAYLGYVNPLIGVSMGLCIMLGAWFGAHSAIKYGNQFIKPIFISVVVALSCYLGYQSWF